MSADAHKKQHKVTFVLNKDDGVKFDDAISRMGDTRQRLLEIVFETLAEAAPNPAISLRPVVPVKFADGQVCSIRLADGVYGLALAEAQRRKFSLSRLGRVWAVWAIEFVAERSSATLPDKEEFVRWLKVRLDRLQSSRIRGRKAG